MLRRVENQGRVENGETKRRENLNEEQRSRSLRSRGEKALESFDEVDAHHLRSLPRELDRLCRLIPVGSIHHALLFRSTRRVMSSGSQARTLRREAASLSASAARTESV